jgi:hypothetical protein
MVAAAATAAGRVFTSSRGGRLLTMLAAGLIAELYAKTDRASQAVDYAARAVALDPGDEDARILLESLRQ